MEKSALIGIILAVVSVLVGMFIKGANPSALLNPAAMLIIFGGTTAAVFIAFPMAEVKKIPTLLKLVFKGTNLLDKREVIKLFLNWGVVARREGILALEEQLQEVDNTFLRRGMTLVVDGVEGDNIRSILEEEIASMKERHAAGAQIFSQAGTYAPTLGVLGAVIGLVAALGNMSDVEKLGTSIAAAFIATLFGIFLGYVICHPFANNLKRRTKNEVELKYMIIEGIISIQSGQNPNYIAEKLSVYLPEKERQLDEEENNKENEGA